MGMKWVYALNEIQQYTEHCKVHIRRKSFKQKACYKG